MIEITMNPIDVGKEFMKLDLTGAGSVVTHVGVVKPDPEGGPSRGIRFADKGGAPSELESIERDLRQSYNLIDVVLVRRMGELEVGDVILVAAISAKGREDAFGACREAVERYKKMKLIDKAELFV